VLWALVVLAVLVGIGLVIRQVVQSHAEPDGTLLARWQRLVMRVFWLQVAVAVFGIGLPALLVWIHHRPFGGLFNSGLKSAGFEGESITITSLARSWPSAARRASARRSSSSSPS
jgi:hypothetical protein